MSRDQELLAILAAGPVPPHDWEFLSQQQRKKAQAGIDALIAALDAFDPDPEAEPWLGAPELPATCAGNIYMPGLGWRAVPLTWARGGNDDREEENEHGNDDDAGESTLGWAAVHSQLSLGENTDDGDNTAPERHGMGFVRCGPDDHEPSLGSLGGCAGAAVTAQTQWAAGGRQDLEQDVHDEPHDDEADREPDLGSLEHREDQRGWASHALDDEPSLGAPEIHHDQRRWAQGNNGSRELDHDERPDVGPSGGEEVQRAWRARQEAQAMLRHRRLATSDSPNVVPFPGATPLLRSARRVSP